MLIRRNIEREDLDVHYFKLLNELSPSLNTYLVLTEESFDKLWSDFVDNNNHHIRVAVSTSNTVGTASLLIEQKINGRVAGHIEDVVVSKSHRGRGIGGSLIKDLIRVAKKEQCYKVILSCSDKNVPFYNKFGFIKTENSMRLTI